MSIGIIGLPNVGKSTLFNCLLAAGNKEIAAVSNYPFCTIEPNIAIVTIPDERLDKLSSLIQAKETVPASLKFMDLAGLIKGASQGEGLGNKFLAGVREAEALVHVVRCFEDESIIHVGKDLNPERDIDIVNIELCLADLELVGKRMEKIKRLSQGGDKNAAAEILVLGHLQQALKRGVMARLAELKPEEEALLKELPLLTLKPVLYLANTGEKDSAPSRKLGEGLRQRGLLEKAGILEVSAKLENELKALSREEEETFRLVWTGERESPLKRLVRACYELLGLVTFYTMAREKLTAWPLKNGEDIVTAAGKIHTDMARGFIKAEVIGFQELAGIGSFHLAKEKGRLKLVGREYQVQDGDVIYVYFN